MLAQLFWNASSYWPIAVASGLLLIVVTFWLYPLQTSGLSRKWQFILPALRVAAICAICLSLLKPTLVRPRTEEEHGAIVILVDRSASMAIADAQMPASTRVALADALGMLPEGARKHIAPGAQAKIRTLARQLDHLVRAESDLDYARLTGRRQERREQDLEEAFNNVLKGAKELSQALTPLADLEPFRTHMRVISEVPEASNRAAWRKTLQSTMSTIEQQIALRQAEADDSLYRSDTTVKEAADRLADMSRFALTEAAITNERTGLLSRIGADIPLYGYAFSDRIVPLPLRSRTQSVKRIVAEPEGGQSRIVGAISTALEDLKGRPVRAVVVFSDGRIVGESATSLLASDSIPVFTIACGEEGSFTDLAIVKVDMPQSAYAGEDVTAKVTLRTTNIPAGEYDVTLAYGEQHLINRVKLDASGTAETEFTFTPEKAGVGSVTISASQLDGEATTLNNSFTRSLKVLQDKLNIMLVTGHPSWDYQYVRNALSRTKWARLSEVVIRDAQLNANPESILQQNVIALFRVSPSMLRPEQIDAIHRAVTERGASVILVPGKEADLEAFARNALLGELLPYRPGSKPVWRSWPGDRPAFRIVPDSAVMSLDAMRLSDDPAESVNRWMNLPPIYHYLAIPRLKPNVIRTLLVEKESSVPVLVESRLGIGRVLFMGIEESWRWRFRVGERDQDRFWLQLIRYSAEEPYTLVSDDLAIDVDRIAARPGDEIRLRTRVAGKSRPDVEIHRDGRLVRVEYVSVEGEAQPGRYNTIIRGLSEGSYDIVVKLPGTTTSLRLPITISQGLEEELADVSADPAALAQISEITGGISARLHDAGQLADHLSTVRHRQGSLLEIPLWTSGYLFMFVLGCLAVEWAMRKRLGLA